MVNSLQIDTNVNVKESLFNLNQTVQDLLHYDERLCLAIKRDKSCVNSYIQSACFPYCNLYSLYKCT